MGSSISRTAAGILSFAAAAVVLSACSSTPSTTTTTTTSRSSTSAQTPTSTSAPTSATAPTTSAPTSSTTSSSTPTCQVSGLGFAVVGQGAAAGTQEVTFSLTNVSATTCTTFGYPGMLLLSASGAALPTTVDRGGSLTFENVAPTRVTLAVGQTAYFNVGLNDVQTVTTTCSSTHNVEVTPPTNTAHATLDVPLGIDACDNGTLHVSAVFASTDAAATQTTAPS